MAETVKARFTRDVGNTPAGTVIEVDEGHPMLRRGTLVPVGTKVDPEAEQQNEQTPLEDMNVGQLRKALEARGLPTDGKKDELKARLNTASVAPTESVDKAGEPGVKLINKDGQRIETVEGDVVSDTNERSSRGNSEKHVVAEPDAVLPEGDVTITDEPDEF